MVDLTGQQSKALELEKHLSVTANAGSGKTRVLVERFVAALRSGTKVERILCLTFTEKAALELREKISARINSEYQSSRKNGSESASSLKEARARMLEANISTIHSFCSQLLREFPIETGIDANFKVLEDFDSSALKEDACAEAVMNSLAEERPSPSGADRGVHNLLVRVGYRRVLELLLELLNNREKIEHARLRGSRILTDEPTIIRHWRNLAGAVAEVVRLNISRKKGDFNDEINSLADTISGGAGLGSLLAELKKTLDKILTKAGTPRKREVVVEDGAKYTLEDALSILRTAFDATSDIPQDLTAPDTGGYLNLLATVTRLYEKSEERYAHKKFLMGALDFDDLQIFTVRLLNGKESVRSTLASRFEHIMVDEFQDTNFLQYEIFLNLLDNFKSDAKLFVVGDAKQSIYRFRNAQVEVSQAASESLSKLQNGLNLSLSESFRMNSDIAGFVNGVFPAVLKGSRVFGAIGFPSMDQTPYNALVPRRPHGATDPIEIFIRANDGHVESENEYDVGDSGVDGNTGDPQAGFAAARIREMVDKGEVIRSVREAETERRIKYGDIAILMRTRARLPLVEGALTEFGVPFVVSSGIGFYSAQEIFDLTNYLTFLLDNNADIPFLAVLRSPFFGISENELYSISMSDGVTLFDKLLRFVNSGDPGDEVRYAASVLKEETQLAQRLTIPELINRILERTGWLGAYRLSPTGDQRIANLRKLLAIAREFEGRGFNSLYDFVERIRYLKVAAQEGQAPVEESVDAVKIMTVHASKGLEFPVVIIPFCEATARHGTSMVVNEQAGVLPFLDKGMPPAFSLYGCLEDLSEQAEISRLFYVACTRAMDKLILTTAPKKESQNVRSFADILSKSIALAGDHSDERIDFNGVKIRIHTKIPQVAVPAERRVKADIEIGDVFLDPVPAGIDGEIYSATVLQTYRLCPTKYFMRYRLGMPTPDTRFRFDENAENDDAILATVKGQLVHSVLERVVSADDPDDETVLAAAREAVASGVRDFPDREKAEKLASSVAENARNAIGTLRTVGQKGKRLSEQTITRKFGSDFLTGTLDLLIEDEKGFHVYDYKTNRLDRSDEEIYSGYEIQMKLYASLCAKLKPDQDEIDVTIIFTREPGRHLRKIYAGKELAGFENELKEMIDGMKAIGTEDAGFPAAGDLPTSSPHCVECEYYSGDGEKECLMNRKRGTASRK
jgi:ATP-dependent helicase/nuclease subunit A